MMKGGFFFSGTVGTGLVVARLPNGVWSAPSAIMLANVGWGFQVGGEVSDVMFVLNSQVSRGRRRRDNRKHCVVCHYVLSH